MKSIKMHVYEGLGLQLLVVFGYEKTHMDGP